MASWSDCFARFLAAEFAGLDREGILARYGWVEEASRKAGSLLSRENLASMPPQAIYAALDAIKLPKCLIRMTNLGRVNAAEEVLEGIARLLSQPGDFAQKYRSGKIPQAGIVTLSQILTLAQPQRFALRNAPFTRALAKQIPLYTARALDELGYEEYLDFCRELGRVLEASLKPFGLSTCLITEKGTAGRLGSVVTTLPLRPDARPYTRYDEYCTRCGMCAQRCFAGSIDREKGKDRGVCERLLDERKIQHAPRYGCGKCNVRVPCEREKPKTARRAEP